MNNEIKQLFERFTKLAKLKTSSKRNNIEKNPNAEYYKNEYYKLDFAPCYGGYVIRKVLKSTGEDGIFGNTRRSRKEMESFLRGLVYGLTFKKYNK